jgi:opacity protein-like surface antigen
LILGAVLVLGAFLSKEVMAQEHFLLGLKAGYNSSTFRTDNAGSIIGEEQSYTYQQAKDDAKNGYILGAYARINLINNLSFQPELLYSKKGGETSFSDSEGLIGTLNTTYYTWDIPLLAHLKLIDLKVLNVYGVAGPVASLNVSDNNMFKDLRSTNTEDIKTAQWGFQTGGGLEVWRFNFDVRYTWGLNEASNKLERKNNNLTFSLGYRIFGF